jgi:hypothetical protein
VPFSIQVGDAFARRSHHARIALYRFLIRASVRFAFGCTEGGQHVDELSGAARTAHGAVAVSVLDGLFAEVRAALPMLQKGAGALVLRTK